MSFCKSFHRSLAFIVPFGQSSGFEPPEIHWHRAELQINLSLLRQSGSSPAGLCKTLRDLSLQQHGLKECSEADVGREGVCGSQAVHPAVAAKAHVNVSRRQPCPFCMSHPFRSLPRTTGAGRR